MPLNGVRAGSNRVLRSGFMESGWEPGNLGRGKMGKGESQTRRTMKNEVDRR